MSTMTSLHYHIVFAVKNREPLIHQNIENRVWQYLVGVARNKGLVVRAVGGVEDHVHMLVDLPARMSVSEAVGLIKGGSSYGIKSEITTLENFAWQEGYGAFTVSPSALDIVASYIRNQRARHKSQSLDQEWAQLEQACIPTP